MDQNQNSDTTKADKSDWDVYYQNYAKAARSALNSTMMSETSQIPINVNGYNEPGNKIAHGYSNINPSFNHVPQSQPYTFNNYLYNPAHINTTSLPPPPLPPNLVPHPLPPNISRQPPPQIHHPVNPLAQFTTNNLPQQAANNNTSFTDYRYQYKTTSNIQYPQNYPNQYYPPSGNQQNYQNNDVYSQHLNSSMYNHAQNKSTSNTSQTTFQQNSAINSSVVPESSATADNSDPKLINANNLGKIDLSFKQKKTFGSVDFFTSQPLNKNVENNNNGFKPQYTSVLPIKSQNNNNNTADDIKNETNYSDKKDNTVWPSSLREYVLKTFKSTSAEARQLVEAQLKKIISSASNKDLLYDIDWDTRPLPKKSRFDQFNVKSNVPKYTYSNVDEINYGLNRTNDGVRSWDKDTIVGTCTNLEKRYLRLTSAPDSATVRPLPVLHESLALMIKKWENDEKYTYICDQLKSIRQDLTVQRITNDFTVRVYETHSRMALCANDLGEYNQCQTQLKQLYIQGVKGSKMEFLAYRILYFIYTRNESDINATLSSISKKELDDPVVKHALKLYKSAPNLGAKLMIHFIERERWAALVSICKAYRPNVSLEFIKKSLGFENLHDVKTFLIEYGIDVRLLNNNTEQHANFFDQDNSCNYYADSLHDLKSAYIDAKLAYPILYNKKAKFNKIDIKGQIS
ncbi:hypothetical protein BB561_003535 [Smittium simulii]|uniref:SAC3/GANP/THP3 conserved domain-containing protein n=1 Tax=Smittium simulii TaxID=133385 RepID=A0A2T9YKR6_9FUNG|nr:hypothetical protein BB561_003535 [Smittium simulii]